MIFTINIYTHRKNFTFVIMNEFYWDFNSWFVIIIWINFVCNWVKSLMFVGGFSVLSIEDFIYVVIYTLSYYLIIIHNQLYRVYR